MSQTHYSGSPLEQEDRKEDENIVEELGLELDNEKIAKLELIHEKVIYSNVDDIELFLD